MKRAPSGGTHRGGLRPRAPRSARSARTPRLPAALPASRALRVATRSATPTLDSGPLGGRFDAATRHRASPASPPLRGPRSETRGPCRGTHPPMRPAPFTRRHGTRGEPLVSDVHRGLVRVRPRVHRSPDARLGRTSDGRARQRAIGRRAFELVPLIGARSAAHGRVCVGRWPPRAAADLGSQGPRPPALFRRLGGRCRLCTRSPHRAPVSGRTTAPVFTPDSSQERSRRAGEKNSTVEVRDPLSSVAK